jgi:RNA polymerase sigma-70 factor (ECF subfamily)
MDINSSNIDERLILRRIVYQQDKKALAILYIKYYPQVKRYITSHVGRVEDAEDLAQEVFIELLKGKGHYNGHGSVKRYLIGMANKFIFHYHERKKRSMKTIPILSIDKIKHVYDNQQSIDPIRKISAKELKKVMEDTTAKLPPKAREAIRLRYYNSLSLKKSAEKANCSVHTFSQRVVDAKKNLRKHKKIFEDKL